MNNLRVTILTDDSYESFVIVDIELFLHNLRQDPRVANKYKQMNIEEFKQWIDEGLTSKQFKKLQDLNKL